ncbi:hypothetical protein MPSYJ_12830 [Mycolicibacterium psychrotolerans]|uniref:Uncharacterized protein n=1 Tax=Mycolicibacterium psychrotolerans TaxID=216929 RepID=A0A7I7M7P9_9MYCO|nr:hypothetical protein MPSYJ_12830 [Mycolicibacterium psychrotolerans]
MPNRFAADSALGRDPRMTNGGGVKPALHSDSFQARASMTPLLQQFREAPAPPRNTNPLTCTYAQGD